ncbi:Branched-chain amino acid ABC transporter, amino acid-binding protein (TC 3.A.1.4.1) [hydrothermal vent metagenome]|uniref:Branched-chain amino acid ABC transporter, amino acid-binding protein (TC 3.A.1.4.1) n=1 Tax=hydrothermal vent metagenome TaxID=652676 RepID=A0A1W1EFL1_9ZZZZ
MNKVLSIIAATALIGTMVIAKEVKIGVVLPLTGPIAAFGQTSKGGLDIAYGANNKLKNGDTIKLIVLDDRGDKVEAATATKRLLHKDNVTVIFGEVASGNSMAMSPVVEKAKTPMLTHASTNPRVTKDKKYVTRACFIDPFQGAVMAKYAIDSGMKTAVVVIDAKQDYSVGLSKAFKKAYTAAGGKIVKTVLLSSGDKDFNAQVSTIKQEKPSIIAFTGYYPEAALMVRQARAMGIDTPFIGADGVGFPELISIAGKAAEGFMYTDHFNEAAVSNQHGKAYVEAFHKKYNKPADSMGALAADAYGMLLAAMNKCIDDGKASDDKECINANLRATKDYDGITGKITIDEKGNAVKSAVINEVKDGKFGYKTTVNP